MGYFSNAAIGSLEPLERWENRSYPSRRETLGYFMEDLVVALEERGISLDKLLLTAPNGLADYYEPLSRVRYFDAPENLTVHELISAIGEVAHCLRKEYGVTHELEQKAIATNRTAEADHPMMDVA